MVIVKEILNKNENLICDYGCGKKANFRFLNGKVCCESNYGKCEGVRQKNRETQIGRNRPEYQIIKIKNAVIERMKNESKEEKKKYGSKKRSIETVLKLCPNFLEYEEIRYNPGNKDELQVRCKNKNCVHSKENDGWYTPNPRTIEHRISCLKDGKMHNGHFYCSKECRITDADQISYFSELRLNYYKNLDKEEHNKLYLYPRRITIEQINKRYPNFSSIEEIRYHPGKEVNKIIQGHCINPNCPNSKEKGGWFDLDRRQLESRIMALENSKCKAKLYFFCSRDCKITSGLFSRKPNSLQNDLDFIKYSKEVWKYTYYSVKDNNHQIKNIDLRSKNFHLDHRYSITEGFKNGVDPKIIAHWKNLEILTRFKNISKHKKCSISLETLLTEIKKIEIT